MQHKSEKSNDDNSDLASPDIDSVKVGMDLPKLDFLKKASAVGIGTVAGQAIAFLILTLLARWMSKDDYGEVRYVINIGVLAATIIAAGLPVTLTRFLAKVKDNKPEMERYFSNVLILYLIMLALTEIVVLILFWPRYLYAIVVLGYSLPFLYLGLLRGRMQYYKLSLTSAAQNLVKLVVLIAIFYAIGITTFNVLLIYALGGWIVILAFELVKPSVLAFKPKAVSPESMKELIKFTLPVLITTLVFSLMTAFPVIILEKSYDFETVAVYSIAFLITFVLGFVPNAITTIIMPKIANLKKKSERLKIFTQSFLLISGTSIVLLILAAIFGKWGLDLVFSNKYSEAYWPMILLGCGAILMGIRNAFSSLWEGGGKPIYSTYDSAGGAIVMIVLAIVLIPTQGPIGAAMAFTVGWAMSVGVCAVFLFRWLDGKIKLE